MIKRMQVEQAEALLGDNYVIGRALTWKTSKYLCFVAGQADPSRYWACATWDKERRTWQEPTLIFPLLSDLVSYYHDKSRRIE